MIVCVKELKLQIFQGFDSIFVYCISDLNPTSLLTWSLQQVDGLHDVVKSFLYA